MLSIIIPVLNEGKGLERHLQLLQPLRQRGCELIGVDGGSTDSSFALLKQYSDTALQSQPGRALQMNAGAQVASTEILLFLHADTQLPANADSLVQQALIQCHWGRFDVQLDNPSSIYKVIASFMNQRSRLSKIATGDQAMFFRKDFFMQIGGFPPIPLMEDVAISKAAKASGKHARLKQRVITSARRWEKNGPLKTILFMWELRLRYFFGQSPQQLAQRYHG